MVKRRRMDYAFFLLDFIIKGQISCLPYATIVPTDNHVTLKCSLLRGEERLLEFSWETVSESATK